MRHNATSRTSSAWWTLIVLGLCCFTFYQFYAQGTVTELREMWHQEREMRHAIQELRDENARIEASIKELSPEGLAVERIARQDFGWAKPGEIVVKIPEKK